VSWHRSQISACQVGVSELKPASTQCAPMGRATPLPLSAVACSAVLYCSTHLEMLYERHVHLWQPPPASSAAATLDPGCLFQRQLALPLLVE
jgi:hypothetical protein